LQEDDFVQKVEEKKKLSKKNSSSQLKRTNVRQLDSPKHYTVTFMQEVAVLLEGDSFGELGLINAQARRAATIICLQDSDFATLDRQTYISLIGKASKRRLDEKVQFLSHMRIFKGMNIKQL